MPSLYFITHPDVHIDPAVPVPDWPLSARGRERMHLLLRRQWVAGLGAVWCSTERKARDGAQIIAAAANLSVNVMPDLRENDRSATGYLPKPQFEAMADVFFAQPDKSIQGWETAAAAQLRIVAAIKSVLGHTSAPSSYAPAPPTADTNGEQDVAVVAHGGVGTLLLCWLKACPISRLEDQPGAGGGNYFCFDRDTYALCHGWRPIDP